jgi:ubiquinone/menaquinone biosynthesis C-methylase UbiE
MDKSVKTTQNTSILELDRLRYPVTNTSIDRYVIANTWTKGQKVLDAATGYGYGAGILLSLGAKSVTGIDIDEEAIKYASGQFKNASHAKFKKADIFNLYKHFEENEFDVCTSVETFEHLPKEKINEYLQSIARVTKEVLFITTPRRKTKEWKYDGGTHLYEYSPEEFKSVLEENFPDKQIGIFGILELNFEAFLNGTQFSQWGSTVYSNNIDQCQVMVGLVYLERVEE